MKLYLYNYYSSSDVDNIYCWEPNKPQWWITGFNPDFNNPNVNDMISMALLISLLSLLCTGCTSAKLAKSQISNQKTAKKMRKNIIGGEIEDKEIIFDEYEMKVWFVW